MTLTQARPQEHATLPLSSSYIDVPWQPGDILAVDNSRRMHGRRTFTDTERRVLIRMGAQRDNV